MPFSLKISDSPDPTHSEINLGQVKFSEGDLVKTDVATIYVHNDGDTVVREIDISTEDQSIGFSHDGEIFGKNIYRENSLFPGQYFTFKAQATYTERDREGQRNSDFSISATSVG